MFDKNINSEIGKRIQEIRVSLGYTLEEFGENLTPPASKSNVSRWEKGKNIPNKARLLSIAKLGGVSTEYLLTGNSQKTKKYIKYLFNEIFFDNGTFHNKFKDFGKDRDRLGLYDLFLAVSKTYSLDKSPSLKDNFVEMIIDDVYKKLLQTDKSDDQLILGFIYICLDEKLSNRQKSLKSINYEVFNYLGVAFGLIDSEIKSTNAGNDEDLLNYLKELTSFIDEIKTTTFNKKKYFQNQYDIE
ncbi:helix-turn-helix domain-containing protein, partial [Enterococcus faecium]|nr:helix-turn-helix domain-containing protein [Enterococcus faecium]MCH3655412.1 helix-turn-helix domain-containing protein [Enterococcus faecium]